MTGLGELLTIVAELNLSIELVGWTRRTRLRCGRRLLAAARMPEARTGRSVDECRSFTRRKAMTMTVSSEHDSKVAERAVLGAALRDRVDDVIDHVRELTVDAGGGLEDAIEQMFREAARIATVAVADWISDGDADAAGECGFETAAGFADLAAFRGASMNEVAKRCLRWRDCIASVLMDQADLLDVSRAAVREALWMTLHSFDVTLVRMCEAYDAERQRLLDDDPAGRP
jgi:hypothetical protein